MNRSPPKSVLSATKLRGPNGDGHPMSLACADGNAIVPPGVPLAGLIGIRLTSTVDWRADAATISWKPRTSPSAAGFQ